MTAINILLEQDRAMMVTDTMVVSENGEKKYKSKIYVIPHLDCAVLSQGMWLAGQTLATVVNGEGKSYDGAAADMEKNVRATYDMMVAAGQKRWVDPNWVIYLVGYSERECKFCAQVLFTREAMSANPGMSELFRAYPLTDATISPHVPSFIYYDDFDIRKDGVELIKHQQSSHGHMVGGRAQLTTLRRGSVNIETLDLWPKL